LLDLYNTAIQLPLSILTLIIYLLSIIISLIPFITPPNQINKTPLTHNVSLPHHHKPPPPANLPLTWPQNGKVRYCVLGTRLDWFTHENCAIASGNAAIATFLTQSLPPAA
jgi:hypothetical protein